MRLVHQKKFTLAEKRISIFISIALLLVFFQSSIFAQQYKQTFTNVSLADALVKVSVQYNCKIAFDAKALSAIKINKEVKANSVQEFLTQLLSNSGYEFSYQHERYLVIPQIISQPQPIQENSCELTGLVTDRETGEQLPFASLFIQNQHIVTATSNSGTFGIQHITENPIHVVIKFIGYAPLDTLIHWSKSKISCNLKLSRKSQLIDNVVIKQPVIEMVSLRNDVDFATSLNPSKLIDLPMQAESDIFRALQLLPGISYNESSSELSIRGGTSDQNLILFDGQTLYNLSHFYGLVSSLNANVIKDIQVYKGGYDSRYGERVSGIVDVTGKSGSQLKPSIYGDINLISGNVTAELPVNNKLTLIAAFRRSYTDFYSTSFADGLFNKAANTFKADSSGGTSESKPSFYFYDYNAKATYRPSSTETFTLSFYGGKDFYKNEYGGDTYKLNVKTFDTNTWNNYGISAAWQKQWSSKYYTSFQIGTSGYNNQQTSNTDVKKLHNKGMQQKGNRDPIPNPMDSFATTSSNKLTDVSLSLRNIITLNDNNQLNVGALARRNSIFYRKDASKVYVYDSLTQASWTTTIYAQDKIILFDNLTLKPGLRLNYYLANKKFYVEPRFSANYRVSNNFSVRLATGKYCQFVSQVQSQQETGYTKSFWVMAQNATHPVINAFHYIAGTTVEHGNFLFDAETYLKTYSGLQEYLYLSPYLRNSDFPDYFPPHKTGNVSPLKQPSMYATGKGQSYGLDFFVRYKLLNYTSWLSYSLSKSVNHFALINNNNEMPALTDQRHQLSFTNMYTWGKWNFGATSLFSTGRPYVDLSNNKQAIQTNRVYKRLPNYFRTDLSANYNFTLFGAHLKTGATVINLFDTQNYLDINTKKFDFDNTSFSETNLIQTQRLSFNVFLHFNL